MREKLPANDFNKVAPSAKGLDAPVSVVIPSYNRADKIGAAVYSALNQSPKPLEIIVVDDGSTDGTDAERLASIDRRVHVIRHPSNRGGGAARNTGIDAATSDWIAFLDSDDQWLPGKLVLQLSQVNNGDDQNIFACGNVQLDGGPGDGQLYNSRPPLDGEDISRYFLLHDCTFQTSTLLVPRLLAREIRFDDQLRCHQDWDFVLRLIKSGARFAYCHEALAKFRNEEDPSRISRQLSVERSLFWLKESGDFIVPDAAAGWYFNALFKQHVVSSPCVAALTGLRLTLRSLDAITWVTQEVLLPRLGRRLRGFVQFA